MSRYIDADALKEECYKFANDVSRSAMAFVQGQINAAPTADVIEVVRCKDCKHAKRWYADKSLCFLWDEEGIDVFVDGYCSYGERRKK